MDESQIQTSVRPAVSGRKSLVALTEAAARDAQPGDVLRDAVVKGLHLRCFPGSKSFYLHFRTKAGKERKPKLGDLGTLNLAAARRAALRILEEVAAGRDPMQERQEARSEHTLLDLWNEWRKRHGARKPSAAQDEEHWNRDLRDQLGGDKLSTLTFSVIADRLDEITARAPITSNRVRALLVTMFNYAIAPLEWVQKNPARSTKGNRENKRKRYMKSDEAVRVAAILKREEATNPAAVAFIYLLIFTGARKGEIAKATWDQIDGTRLVLDKHKTAERTGEPRVINLPEQAMAVLAKLPRDRGTITGMQDPWFFWSKVRAEAGARDLRIHDLRHSFASAAIGAGLTLAQIGELLGHDSEATTQRYAHLMEDSATAVTAVVADAISARMNPQTV